MINYIKQYFRTLKINPNQLESNMIINIIVKSSCQGSINMVKWKGVDKREKGGISNGIYWNFIFNNRHINMYKSFIKIKIKE